MYHTFLILLCIIGIGSGDSETRGRSGSLVNKGLAVSVRCAVMGYEAREAPFVKKSSISNCFRLTAGSCMNTDTNTLPSPLFFTISLAVSVMIHGFLFRFLISDRRLQFSLTTTSCIIRSFFL